jgi:hypothetical protein
MKSILKYIDFFGSEIKILINGKSKYNSSLGGFFTFILLFITVYFIFYLSDEIFFRKNPKLIHYQSYSTNNSVLINNSNFFIAYQVLFPNNTILDFETNSYFEFQLFAENINKINSNISNKKTFYTNQKCQMTDLKDFYINENLSEYMINSFRCFNLSNLILNGSPFHSLSTKTLRFSINFAYNKLIKDYGSTINLYLKNVFPLNFRIFYQTSSYNLNNYDNPLKKELSFADIRIVPETLTHIYASFIKYNSVKDEGLVFKQENMTNLYGFNDFKLVTINNFLLPNHFFSELFKIFFYIEYFENNFIRSYSKLQDMGSQILAIYNFLYFLMHFFLYFYSINRINEQLAYKFYKYTPQKTIRISEDINLNNFINQKTINDQVNNYSQVSRVTKSTITLPKIFLNSISKDFEQTKQNQNSDLIYGKKSSIFDKSFLKNHKKNNNNIFSNKDSFSFVKNDSKKKFFNKSKIFNKKNESIQYENILEYNKFLYQNDSKKMGISSKKKSSVKFHNEKIHISNIQYSNIVKKVSEKNETEKILGLFEKIKYNLCCFFFKKNNKIINKMKFYEKSSQNIKKKLDIGYFLTTFEEFQKFKILFLNPYQSISLQYTNKPNILNINLSNVVDYYENFCNSQNHLINVEKISEYFKEKIKNSSLNEIDLKIFEILDENLKKIIIIPPNKSKKLI